MTSALIMTHLTGVIKQDWCLHKAVTKNTPWIDFSMSVRNKKEIEVQMNY